MKESFAPKVIVDGQCITPEGWMWILGFALGGCEWAIKQALDPSFDMDGKVRNYLLRKTLYNEEEELKSLEGRVQKIRNDIEQIAKELKL